MHGTEHAGQTVFVTGGGRGIGAALCAAFLEADAARVIAADRTGGDGSGRLERLRLDVADPVAVAQAAAKFGAGVDILVNNAGVNGAVDLFAEHAAEIAMAEFRVNALGLLNMTAAFGVQMAARPNGGTIVNILSVLSQGRVPAMASYCASKAAAWSLAESARMALEPRGVRVVNVFPRMVDTAMSAGAPGSKMKPEALARSVLAALREGVLDCYP